MLASGVFPLDRIGFLSDRLTGESGRGGGGLRGGLMRNSRPDRPEECGDPGFLSVTGACPDRVVPRGDGPEIGLLQILAFRLLVRQQNSKVELRVQMIGAGGNSIELDGPTHIPSGADATLELEGGFEDGRHMTGGGTGKCRCDCVGREVSAPWSRR